MPSAGDVGAGMFDPFNQLPARLLAASADLEIARLWNAPVHTALLREAAEALEQRLGLLRDVERRLEEAAALISTPSQAHMQLTDPPPRSVLDIHLRAAGFTPDRDLCSAAWLILQALTTSKAKVAELELAARKRQATIDRQGQELGDLRKRREGPSHLPALLESLRLAGIEPNGTLLESCTLAVQALLAARAEVEDAQAKAAMFRRRTERLQAWFALPPDQRHPLGPEFTPDLEPEPSALAHAWAKLEANADGYLLCTHCRRERSAGRKAVQGCGDCRWLNNDEREDVSTSITQSLTFADASAAYSTAKTKATKGHCDWLVWQMQGVWHAAKRSLVSLELVAAAEKFTTVDGHGRLFKGNATSATLQIKNMRAGF